MKILHAKYLVMLMAFPLIAQTSGTLDLADETEQSTRSSCCNLTMKDDDPSVTISALSRVRRNQLFNVTGIVRGAKGTLARILVNGRLSAPKSVVNNRVVFRERLTKLGRNTLRIRVKTSTGAIIASPIKIVTVVR